MRWTPGMLTNGMRIFLIAVALPAGAYAQLFMYGIDLKRNRFVKVNVATTEVTELGKPDPNVTYEAMAFDPATSFVFLAADVSNTGSLRRATKTDLNASDPVPITFVGNFPSPDIESLSVNPVTGGLYGVNNDSRRLVLIDKNTGNATNISSSSQPLLNGVQGLAFTITDPPLLYAVARISGENRLVQVDFNVGTASLVHPTNTIGFNGKIKALAFAPGPDIFTPGTLYGFHESGKEFITIDINTGIGTVYNVIDPENNRQIEGLTFLKPDKLIPVELSRFSATLVQEGVLLSWTTETETENLGFHVYRSRTKEGEYRRINPELIPGQGNTARAHTYQFVDQNVQTGKTYYYKLADQDYNGTLTFHGPIEITVSVVPAQFVLEQNYPNPFKPGSYSVSTQIRYQLREAGHVSLTIFDVLGRSVIQLVNETQQPGSYSIMWDGKDASGRLVAEGVYFYRLKTDKTSQVKKMLVIP